MTTGVAVWVYNEEQRERCEERARETIEERRVLRRRRSAEREIYELTMQGLSRIMRDYSRDGRSERRSVLANRGNRDLVGSRSPINTHVMHVMHVSLWQTRDTTLIAP